MGLCMNKKVTYSIAMSKETGAIVMVRTRGKVVEVMGSMSREQSMDFQARPVKAEPRIRTMAGQKQPNLKAP